MAKILKRFCDQATPPEKNYAIYWDDEIPGFGLLVTAGGHKSFVCQYRNEAGRSKRLTLGRYGTLTPEQARKMAQDALAGVLQGRDPQQAKQEHRKGLTVADLAERYLSEHAEPKKKPSSLRNDRRNIKDIIIPVMGHRKIKDIQRADVAKLHHDLRGTPIHANRVMALLSKMFSLAEKWGLRPDGSNPCHHVEKYKERKRERFLSGEELARLGAALAEAEGIEHPSAVLAIRLLMFTGARLMEILTSKWSYIDWERGVLRLPDSKTGAKVIALSGPALDCLNQAGRLEGNPYVCFGDKAGGHLVGLQKIWERIRAKAGLEGLRLHDLRHSFASVAAAANLGLPLIGALLGHSQPATTARYAHLAMDPLKAAMDEVARRIDDAMKQPVKRKVVPIRGKG